MPTECQLSAGTDGRREKVSGSCVPDTVALRGDPA